MVYLYSILSILDNNNDVRVKLFLFYIITDILLCVYYTYLPTLFFCFPGHFINPIYTRKSPRDRHHRFSFSPIAVYTSTVKLSNLSSFEHNLNIMNEKKIEILEERNKHFTRLNVTRAYKVSTMTADVWWGCSRRARAGDTRKTNCYNNNNMIAYIPYRPKYPIYIL